MAIYNIKMNQNDGSSFNLFRPETAAKYCYVSKEVSSLFNQQEETPVEYFLKQCGKNNFYHWEKTTNSWSKIQGNIVEGRFYTGNYSSDSAILKYSSTCEIDQSTGKTMLSGDVTSLEVQASTPPSVDILRGKYIFYNNDNPSYTDYGDTVLQITNDTVISSGHYGSGSGNKKYYISFTKVYQILSKKAVSVEYLNDSDPSSYPIYNESNGVSYRFLGRPCDLYQKAAKIITRSYIGTGVGTATISFEYQPMVIFFGNDTFPNTTLFPVSNYVFYWNPSGQIDELHKSTLTYTNNPPSITTEFNDSGVIYYYTVIC